MDSTVLLSVVGGALLLSIIFVTGLCINCFRSKQPTTISQRSSDSSPEHPTPGFVVRHPQSTYASYPDHNRINYQTTQLPHSLSSPSFSSAVKSPSCPPSETGSQASYVNQSDREDEQYQQPTDETDNNYITVIPDSQSKASSHSSGENYINVGDVEDESDKDDNDYINLQNSPLAQSYDSKNSDDRGSSDYVNTAPNLL
ncbi:linker for activation of T-cells family member 1 isoform X1 [Paramisgurnus dabryanus]|uniref:linker for activation of T-cells family member 1 isoform X1 n=1 Tax=Paramisgurnus dabryanus TaxID=90735 RepID=UPI003CCF0D66